jgi:hydrogenase nickel incorporation protein HypB
VKQISTGGICHLEPSMITRALPGIFRRAELALITKSDLLAYVDFDIARARAGAGRVHPALDVMVLSCLSGEGMCEQQWLPARRAPVSIKVSS